MNVKTTIPFHLFLLLNLGPIAVSGLTVVLPGTISGPSTTGIAALVVLDATCRLSIGRVVFEMVNTTLTICVWNTGTVPYLLVHPALNETRNSFNFTGLSVGMSGDWTLDPSPLLLRPGNYATIPLFLAGNATVTTEFLIMITGYEVT